MLKRFIAVFAPREMCRTCGDLPAVAALEHWCCDACRAKDVDAMALTATDAT